MNPDGGSLASPQDVTAFWRAAGPKKWFRKDADFDREITARFLATHEAAAAGRLAAWEATPEGALALLLPARSVSAQHVSRQRARFLCDRSASPGAVADRAIAHGFDTSVEAAERAFFYLPFEHSENAADQERSLALSRQAGGGNADKYAEIHADIIRRFGRFPHRNAVLGRATTPQEQAFLDAGGFAG